MSQSARIARNSFYLILAKGINTAFVLIYLPFLARYLGREGFGLYTFIYAFVGMFQVLAWLGVHRILVREVARFPDRASWYYNNALSIKLLLSLATALTLILAVYVRHDLDLLNQKILLIAGAEMLIRTYGTVNASVFRAFEQMYAEPILVTIDLGISTAGVFIAIILDLGLTGVMLAFLCGAMAYTLAGFVLVRRVIAKPALQGDISAWIFMVKEGLPIGGSVGISRLYARQGTVYLRSSQDVAQVGIYGGGLRIYNLVIIISAAIVSSLFPALSRLALDIRNRLMASVETALKLLTVTAGAIAMSLFLVSEIVVSILLGSEFEEVVSVVRLLSPAIVFAFAGTLFSNLLESTNLQRLNTLAWVTVLTLNLGLNIILAPKIGYMGTTLALLTTEILFALVTFYFVWKKVGHFAVLQAAIKPLVLVSICWSIGWILWSQLGLGALFIALLLYGFLIWRFRVFTKEEIKILYSISAQFLPSKV